MRRVLTIAGSTLAILVLLAATAFAGECYNASRSDTGNTNATNGRALESAEEFIGALHYFRCDSEAAALQTSIEDEIAGTGLDLGDVVVNTQTTMASGVEGTDHSNDNRGIDHLDESHEEIMAALACLHKAAA